MKIKEYSTAWLKEEIRIAQEAVEANPHMAATLLLGDLKRYVEHISANAKSKGKVTSTRKAASSAANGAKGGRPKGSKNKPKAFIFTPETVKEYSETKKAKNYIFPDSDSISDEANEFANKIMNAKIPRKSKKKFNSTPLAEPSRFEFFVKSMTNKKGE